MGAAKFDWPWLWLCCTRPLSGQGGNALFTTPAETAREQTGIEFMFQIMARKITLLAVGLIVPTALLADPLDSPKERHRIGYGLMFSNDLFGDGKDRWRTGSLTSSRLYGYGWDGQAPAGFAELLELRLQGQILSPEGLTAANPADRPWAGAFTAELHTHMQRDEVEISLGGGLAMVGPQTQLDELQGWLHDVISSPQASDAVLALQVPDKIRPVVSAEVGRVLTLSPQANLRPFIEARAGDETYLRAGVDMTFGQLKQGGLLVRETVTGQRYRTQQSEAGGLSFTLGADIAYVADSIYLPDSTSYDPEHSRHRARLGLRWQGSNASAFYGLTYLSEEFSTQDEGQITGSLQLQMRF